jgi:hypothetical protein
MFTNQNHLKIHMTDIHDLLAVVKRRYVKSKQRLSAVDHDDNQETSPTGQGRDDDPPGSEHKTEPKSQHRHRAAPAEDEIAAWYENDELDEKSAGQGHHPPNQSVGITKFV